MFFLSVPCLFVSIGFLSNIGSFLALARHPPPLHRVAATQKVTPVGAIICRRACSPRRSLLLNEIACAPGNLLALFTNGMSEILKPGGREFGYERPGGGASRATSPEPLGACLVALQAAARAWGPQTDNQTLLLLRYAPGAFASLG